MGSVMKVKGNNMPQRVMITAAAAGWPRHAKAFYDEGPRSTSAMSATALPLSAKFPETPTM
jgi:hypothetical protein